jgi:hypothetical protein
MFIIKKTGDEEYSTTRGTNTNKIIIPQNITNTYNELTTNFLPQQNPTLENKPIKQNIPKSTYNLNMYLSKQQSLSDLINLNTKSTTDVKTNEKSTQRNPDSTEIKQLENEKQQIKENEEKFNSLQQKIKQSLAYKFAEWYLNNFFYFPDGNNDMTSRNKIQVIQNQLNKIIEKLPLNVNDAVRNEYFVNNYLKMKWYNKTNIKCNKKQFVIGKMNFEMFVLQFFEPVFNKLFNDLKRVQNFNTYFKIVKTTFEEKINEIITILFNYKYCLDKENFEVITDGKRKNKRFRK